MKKNILLIAGLVISLTIMAQGNSGNNKKDNGKSKSEKSVAKKDKKQKEKEEKATKNEHNKKVWDGTYGKRSKGGPKPSVNQPNNVRDAFQKDYPNATNVSWSKYRGDWSVAFQNGSNMSTAVYHANGERKDTRTPVTKNEIPGKVLDSILKKRPGPWLQDAIKIQLPNIMNNIYRIKNDIQGEPGYLYYNSNGQLVKYDY
jgi:hypothetical protein